MLFRGENFGTWERFTVSFMQHLYLLLPSHSAYSPFYSSIYAEIRNPVARDRATSAEMSRSAVFFWWYVANTIRVLELLTRVLLIPYFSCILNVFLFFLWDFFSYALRIFLPNTVTLCKLCCPWDIQLRIQFRCILLSDFKLESTFNCVWPFLQQAPVQWYTLKLERKLTAYFIFIFLFFFQNNSCTCKGGEWLGDRGWCAADGIWDVPSPLTEEVLCHWQEEENKEANWPCHYWLGWGRPAARASERWGAGGRSSCCLAGYQLWQHTETTYHCLFLGTSRVNNSQS